MTRRKEFCGCLAAALVVFTSAATAEDAKTAHKHPYPGIWAEIESEAQPTTRQLARACLTNPFVVHDDGLVVAYQRRTDSFSLRLGEPFFKVVSQARCAVSDQNIETCERLDGKGEVEHGTEDSRYTAKLAPQPDGRIRICGVDEKTKAVTPDVCTMLVRCRDEFFDLTAADYRLRLDITKRPGAPR